MSEHDNSKRQDEVTITVNGTDYLIHRGAEPVAEIKQAGHVALADDLEQVVDGRLEPLPDDGKITIKGGETFISHSKDAASS